MTELRWCIVNNDGTIGVYKKPTAPDALEFADDELKMDEEFHHAQLDMRLKSMAKIKELLMEK